MELSGYIGMLAYHTLSTFVSSKRSGRPLDERAFSQQCPTEYHYLPHIYYSSITLAAEVPCTLLKSVFLLMFSRIIQRTARETQM